MSALFQVLFFLSFLLLFLFFFFFFLLISLLHSKYIGVGRRFEIVGSQIILIQLVDAKLFRSIFGRLRKTTRQGLSNHGKDFPLQSSFRASNVVLS